jgi:YcaO-like protein with predicted kinase domain
MHVFHGGERIAVFGQVSCNRLDRCNRSMHDGLVGLSIRQDHLRFAGRPTKDAHGLPIMSEELLSRFNAPAQRRLGTGPGYKAFRNGTHRIMAPAATLARLKPLMEPMGITRIADVTGLDRIGLPVVMVCRPNSRSVAVSQGKGLDLDAAKASGLMEAIETWHAERIALPLTLGSFNDLVETHPLVDVALLPRIEDSRYHPDLQMLWIEGQDLATSEAIWLPYEMVHSNYTVPRPLGHGCFPASTNGLASGNDFLEAACHAICEVIERDSTSIWHHLDSIRRQATRIDPRTVDDANCRQALDMFRAADLDIAIWDTTTDIAIPSFFCLLMDEGTDGGHMGAGAGCHPTRAIALLRALTEAAQTRTTYIAGSRDDLRPEEYEPKGIAQKYRFARRVVSGGGPERDFGSVPTWEFDSFEQDLQCLLDQLDAVGCNRVIAVDLSRPELGVSVVRIVIPGIEAPHDEDDYLAGPRAQTAARRSGR